MSKGGDLKNLMKKDIVVAPGVFNALCAKIAEKCGFKALYVSGAAISASCGLPDTGVLDSRDFLRQVDFIVRATPLPVIVDIDTGFGGRENLKIAIEQLESMGAAGVQIEDQGFPKKCGHLEGKSLVSISVMIEKLAAIDAIRKDKDFLIIARTDARGVKGEGLEEAMIRSFLYRRFGKADIIFPEALESKKEFRKFSKLIAGPLMANMTEFGKTPYISVEEFKEMGYGIVIFPVSSLRLAAKSMEKGLKIIKKKGTQESLISKMQTRQELYDLLDYDPMVN